MPPGRTVWRASIVAIAAVVAIALWRSAVWANVAPKNFGVVEVSADRQIYRSGELTVAATARVVRLYGVRTIVDLGAHEPGTAEERIAERTAAALGVRRVRLDLEGDSTGDPNDYVRALRIMNDPEAQPVLVHCGAGAERTGCAVAMYRQIEQGWDEERAYAETKRYRHSTRRNPLVRHMLETYTDDVARALATGAPIEPSEERSEAPAPADPAGEM